MCYLPWYFPIVTGIVLLLSLTVVITYFVTSHPFAIFLLFTVIAVVIILIVVIIVIVVTVVIISTVFFSLDRTLPRASSRQASSTEVNHQLIDIYFFLFLIHKDTHSLSCFRRRDSWPIYSQSSANIPPGHFK